MLYGPPAVLAPLSGTEGYIEGQARSGWSCSGNCGGAPRVFDDACGARPPSGCGCGATQGCGCGAPQGYGCGASQGCGCGAPSGCGCGSSQSCECMPQFCYAGSCGACGCQGMNPETVYSPPDHRRQQEHGYTVPAVVAPEVPRYEAPPEHAARPAAPRSSPVTPTTETGAISITQPTCVTMPDGVIAMFPTAEIARHAYEEAYGTETGAILFPLDGGSGYTWRRATPLRQHAPHGNLPPARYIPSR